MNMQSRFLRFVVGLVALLIVLTIGFTIAYQTLPTFGATPEEANTVLPGDEMTTQPVVRWRHAITIDAPVEKVWQWIIQMGDNRGGFYSYMFIERAFDPTAAYINADRIHEEWQNPPVGQNIINTIMSIQAIEPGKYMLAAINDPTDMAWTWLWHIAPTADGKTRMNVHMAIEPISMPDSPAFTIFMNLGAFIMERNMMTGLKLRAEGGYEPLWVENIETAIWFGALIIGIAAGVLYMRRAKWQVPLAVALTAAAALVLFTFVQPAIWLRALIDLALVAALVYDGKQRR